MVLGVRGLEFSASVYSTISMCAQWTKWGTIEERENVPSVRLVHLRILHPGLGVHLFLLWFMVWVVGSWVVYVFMIY